MNLKEMQKEMAAWQSYNFPTTTYLEVALGLAEEVCDELGQLLILDRSQESETSDAIGDSAIYFFNLCNLLEVDVESLKKVKLVFDSESIDRTNEMFVWACLVVYVGKISHCVLKKKQNIRGDQTAELKTCLAQAWYLLNILSEELTGQAVEKVAAEIWQEVRKRDWVAYPTNGVDK